MAMTLFCTVGLHWRMKIKEVLYYDIISDRRVVLAECPCGKRWMTSTVYGFPLSKTEMK